MTSRRGQMCMQSGYHVTHKMSFLLNFEGDIQMDNYFKQMKIELFSIFWNKYGDL